MAWQNLHQGSQQNTLLPKAQIASRLFKNQEVKSEFIKEAKGIVEVMEEYSRSIKDIEDQISKLEMTQVGALEKSDEIRNKAIQDINHVFDAIDSEIIAFLHDKNSTSRS